MTTTSVDIPEGLREEIDREVEEGNYTSQSEVIRDAIRRLIQERNTVDEDLSEKVAKEIQEARDQNPEDVRELISKDSS